MASTYHADIQALYVAYFNRPADYLGLDFWEKAIESAVAAAGTDPAAQAAAKAATLAQISAGFAASDEYLDVYGGLPTEQVIGQVYQNLFGHAPDLAGLVFWVNAVRAGHMTIANAVTTIADGALGTDLEAIQNKTAAAVAFTNELDTGEEVLAYNDEDALLAAKQWMSTITTDASLAAAIAPAAIKATVAAVVDAGQPEIPVVEHVLTAGIDTIPGTAGIDVITGVMDGAVVNSDKTTFTALDSIDGGTGSDILNIQMISSSTIGSGVSIANVETVNVRSAANATVTSTAWTGVTNLNVTQAVDATVTAGSSTAVAVSGATGAVKVNGGASQTVSTSGTTVTLGDAAATKGAISVTHTAQGANDIYINGGSTVSVSSTGSDTGSSINVGAVPAGATAAVTAATGAVTVTSAHDEAIVDAEMAAINVTGGSTITVTQSAVSEAAATDETGSTVTQGAVTIVGSTATTSVTVKQTASTEEELFVAADAGARETATVKFGALKAGDKLTLSSNGDTVADATELSFTATKDMTAAEVAAAFANLTSTDTQSNGPASKGVYTQANSGWTSASATGDTVVFTASAAPATSGTNKADLKFVITDAGTLGDSVAPVVAPVVDGKDKVTGVEGVLGVITGTVTIDDNATAASITSVTVDGYGAGSTIGVTNTLSKLANLSLANSGSAVAGDTDATMTVDAAGITSLNLTVNAIEGAVSLDASGTASIETLNLTAAGASEFALTAAKVKTLVVNGADDVALTGDLQALETVTVSGSAGLELVSAAADTIKSVNTTGTTGTVAVTIEGARATYTGGAGKDMVTLVTDTSISKAISLGAGDDTLSFGTTAAPLAVTGSTVTLAGGEGTDTLSMAAATAAVLDNSTAFATQLSGFERLSLGQVAAGTVAAESTTIDLANLGFTNYVRTAGTADVLDTLVLDKMATGGTVVLTSTGLVAVNVAGADTGTADVLNVSLSSANSLTAGTLTAADVETINISQTDTDTVAGSNSNALVLTAADATSVVVTGGALTLTMTGSTAVTSIDGSAMTGALVVTSLNTDAATTIKGGAGNDKLTAATGNTADVLLGGAGNDTLTGNAGLTTMTGGAGADTFVVAKSLNSSSYATITDFTKDDLIKFTGADSFASAKIVQADTAVFQDYANAAMNAIGVNDVAWFQFGGNTYIVMDAGGDSTSFVNGEDFIVKLTGLVDLTNGTFNDTSDTIGLPTV